MTLDFARHNDDPGINLDRLAAGGAIDMLPPIRGPRWYDAHLLIEGAIGVAILAALSYLALVALP